MVARAELSSTCPAFYELSQRETFEPYCGQVLRRVEDLVEEAGFAETPEGRACLKFVLAQSAIMRPLLRSTSRLLSSPLMLRTGGEDYNPHREIDEPGGHLARRVALESGQPMSLHVEELGWVTYNTDGQEFQIAVVDPIDGTSGINSGVKDQATGILMADCEGNFLAGSVASLVDKDLVLIEEEPKLLEFDETQGRLSQLEFPKREYRGVDEARIATLKRRMPLLKDVELFKKHVCPDLLSSGGYVFLCMLRGQIDVCLDPFKGQPWYEAVLWGWMAQESGLIVTDEKGEPIDFSQVLRRVHQCFIDGEGEALRVKMVITTHRELHEQVLKRLKPKIRKAVFEKEVVYQQAA